MLFQIPYNFQFEDKVIDIILKNKNRIHTIYFGFGQSSRKTRDYRCDFKKHFEKMNRLHKKGFKLAYVLNSVLPFEDFEEEDVVVLSSGIIDTIVASQDKIYDMVIERFGDNFKFEVSRFYFLLDENKENKLLKKANSIAFGFEKELEKYLPIAKSLNPKIQVLFIANEHCYEACNMKLVHNRMANLYNLYKTDQIFVCPFQDKKHFFTDEELTAIIKKYSIDVLKICDRQNPDDILYENLKHFFKF